MDEHTKRALEILERGFSRVSQESIAQKILLQNLSVLVARNSANPRHTLRELRAMTSASISIAQLAPSDTARAMENRQAIREICEAMLGTIEEAAKSAD